VKQFAAVFFLLVLTAGCTKPPPVVVLDGWWNADFAKETCRSAKVWHNENARLISRVGCDRVTSCREMMVIVEACVLDPVQDVRRFENDLATEFAASAECDAVKFIRYEGPHASGKTADDAVSQKNYSLSLDYVPGSPSQQWKMLSPNTALTQGEGNPEQIAKKVCIIAKGQGAALSN